MCTYRHIYIYTYTHISIYVRTAVNRAIVRALHVRTLHYTYACYVCACASSKSTFQMFDSQLSSQRWKTKRASVPILTDDIPPRLPSNGAPQQHRTGLQKHMYANPNSQHAPSLLPQRQSFVNPCQPQLAKSLPRNFLSVPWSLMVASHATRAAYSPLASCNSATFALSKVFKMLTHMS